MTGDNEQFIKQLPDLTGMKSEVIIQKSHRNPFDHQLRTTGIKLIEIETRDDLRKAVTDKTAMMHFTNFANAAGQIKVDEWVKLGKEYKVACMNDAAADTPPVSHLWDYANMGYDLITFSGGKAIRGPQCAGLLIGARNWCERVTQQQPARRHARTQSESRQGRNRRHGEGAGTLSERRPRCPLEGLAKSARIHLRKNHRSTWSKHYLLCPGHRQPRPHMEITWDPLKIALIPQQVSRLLRESRPSIVMAAGDERPNLSMCSFMLQPGEHKIVADKLVTIFREHGKSS